MKIAGKSVFLTGGAGGLGCAIARCVLQNGARVCLADVDETRGQEILRNLQKEFGEENVIFVTCDISNEEKFKDAFNKALDAFKTIDIMINNASILNEKNWKPLISINLMGTMTGTYIARDHMRTDKGGQGGVIINIASVAALEPQFYVPAYSAAKSGVLAYTRALSSAPDVSELGVRYACICPGAIDTPMGWNSPSPFLQGYSLSSIPPMVKIKPEKVAETLLTIVEDDDSNGVIILVDAAGGVRKRITVIDHA